MEYTYISYLVRLTDQYIKWILYWMPIGKVFLNSSREIKVAFIQNYKIIMNYYKRNVNYINIIFKSAEIFFLFMWFTTIQKYKFSSIIIPLWIQRIYEEANQRACHCLISLFNFSWVKLLRNFSIHVERWYGTRPTKSLLIVQSPGAIYSTFAVFVCARNCTEIYCIISFQKQGQQHP